MELEVEATRMGSLRHPNTVLFMGACLQEDYFCIVSEYCTRGSLFNVLHAPKASSSRSRHKRKGSNRSPAQPLPVPPVRQGDSVSQRRR